MNKPILGVTTSQPDNDEENTSLGYWDLLGLDDLAAGHIYLVGAISGVNYINILQQVNFLRRRDIAIILHICSYGGGVYESIAIHDVLAQKPDATGIVEGIAASAASMIVLQGCQKRVATKMSRLIFHELQLQPGILTQTDLTETEARSADLQRDIYELLRKRSKLSAPELRKILGTKKSEVWLTPEKAKRYGFIDEVI